MFRIFPFMFNNINIFSELFNNILLEGTVDKMVPSDLGNNGIQEDFCDVELKDCGDYYLIKGYLPGISARDVRIDFKENMVILTIRKNQTYYNNSNIITTVIQTKGNLVKTFPVEEVEKDNIGASFENNILLLTLPKKKHIDEYNKDNTVIVDVDNYTEE